MTLSDTIAELRKLEGEACPAPWEKSSDGDIWSPSGGCDVIHAQDESFIQDAALIVAMRNNLGAILTRLERLERVAEAARKSHEESPYEVDRSGRCDRNTNNRTTALCECGTNSWIEADEALGGALAALGDG